MTYEEHDFLKDVGKKILLEKGFKETEIFFEYNYNFNNVRGRIDVAAVRNGKAMVAIECGYIVKDKIKLLKKEIAEVIHLPYSFTGKFFFKGDRNYFESTHFEKLKELQQTKEKNAVLLRQNNFLEKRNEFLLDVLKVVCNHSNLNFYGLKAFSEDVKFVCRRKNYYCYSDKDSSQFDLDVLRIAQE